MSVQKNWQSILKFGRRVILTIVSPKHYTSGLQVLRPETNPTTNLTFVYNTGYAIYNAPIPSVIWRRRFFKRDVLVFVKSKERIS